MSSFLTFSGGTVRFPKGEVLNIKTNPPKVNIDNGSICLLVGSNGCGKSTLLQIVSRVYPVFDEKLYSYTNISATFFKEESKATIVPHIHRKKSKEYVATSGFLSQPPQSNVFSLSVEEELAFALENTLISKSDLTRKLEKALSCLEEFGLKRNQHPHKLSKGQQQILGFESIVLGAPDILVLDEPSAALDEKSLDWLVNRICELVTREEVQIALIATQDHRLISALNQYPKTQIVRVEAESEKSPPPFIKIPSEIGDLQPKSFSCDNLGVRRGHLFWQNFNLNAEPGDLIALTGPNGSGKTSILESISGHSPVHSGYVSIGTNRKKAGKIRRPPELAYSFQNAEDQISFVNVETEFIYPKKRKGWIENCSNMRDRISLFNNSVPWRLSYGQRKFLVYSTLIYSSSVLLLDEPISALDPEFSSLLSSSLDHFRGDGGIVVISTSWDIAALPFKEVNQVIDVSKFLS